MASTLSTAHGEPPELSPLVLADRMLTLAQDLDFVGFRTAASDVVGLAYGVLDNQPGQPIPSFLSILAGAPVAPL